MITPENARRESFVNAYGQKTTVEYTPVKVLGDARRGRYKLGEGEVSLVEARISGRMKTFVVKHLFPVKPDRGDVVQKEFNESVSPSGILKKWTDLKTAGVAVLPTLRKSTQTKRLLTTDLSQNEKREVLDIGYTKMYPDWFIDQKDNILDQLVENAEKAGNIGYGLAIDSYMVTYDLQTNKVKAWIADLGKGVYKHDTASAHGNVYTLGYVLQKKGVFDWDYWDNRYPEHKI